jgi:large-conductance mechanosensitive channel
MIKINLSVFNFIFISAVIFFIITFMTILLGKPKKIPSEQRNLDFKELFIDCF